jgi:hypothetical protein
MLLMFCFVVPAAGLSLSVCFGLLVNMFGIVMLLFCCFISQTVMLWWLLLFVGGWNAVCDLLSQGIATWMLKFICVLPCFRVISDSA